MLKDNSPQQETTDLLARIKELEAENAKLKSINDALESRLSLILEKVPMLFFQVDKEGVFKDIHGKGLRLLANTREEVIGMSAYEMGKRWPGLAEAVNESLEGKALSRILHTADGQSFQATQIPVLDSQGKPDGFMGVAFDVTEHLAEEKRSRYKDSFLRFFVKHAPAAIAMLDKEMNYLMVSDRWIEDYRLGGKDLKGQNHYEVFNDVPDRWKEVHKRCLRGVTESCEEDIYLRNDGYVDYVNWVVTPWYTEENEVGGLIFFTELVTERVENKKRQKEFSKAIELNLQRTQEFVFALSHNLRDPLESARMLVEYIKENLNSNKKGSLPKTVSFLYTHLSRMTRMVGELHEYANGDNKFGKHKIDLSETIEQVISNLEPQLSSGETLLSYHDLPEIYANEFEMIALFQHLLGNAIRYYRGEKLEIIVEAVEKDEQWLIKFSDNGPGMSETDQTEIFDLFRQLDADQSKTGIGISLPMTRRIVERMGGQIWVESKLGEGTTFWISLPRHE
ncbi:MAG: ATP-binding protein [Bacteroidia bacterium]|nr:ATP-binding protein [Bacteroidia bacterium]